MNTFNSNNPRGGAWRGPRSSLNARVHDMLYRFQEDGPPPRPQPLPLAETARGNLRKLTQMLQRRASGQEDEKIMGSVPTAATGSPGITGAPHPFAAAAQGDIHKLAQLLREDVHQSLKSQVEAGMAYSAARTGGAAPEPQPEEQIVLPSIDELLGPGIRKSGPRLHIDEVPCATSPGVVVSCRVKSPSSASAPDYVNSNYVDPKLKNAVKHLYENSGYGPEFIEFARQNDVKILTRKDAPYPARFYWESMGADENGNPKPGDKKIVINPDLIAEKYGIGVEDNDKMAFIIAHEIAQMKYGEDDPNNCTRFGTSEAWVEDVFEPRYLRDFPGIGDFAAATRDPRTFKEIFKNFRDPEMTGEQKSAILSRTITEGLQHMNDVSRYPAMPEPRCGKQEGKK